MPCALGVTAVVIGLAAGPAADGRATRRAFLLHLKPMDQGTVRRARGQGEGLPVQMPQGER
jgi:hypothetical protein